MRILPCGVVLASLVSFATAEADVAKAATVARDGLPANVKAIAGLDVAALVKTAVWQPLFDAFKREERQFGIALEVVKSACSLDPTKIVEGIVVAGDPEKDTGVVLVQLSIDRAKTSTCIEQVLKTVAPKASVKQDGVFTVVGEGSDLVYVAWPAANVMAFNLEPEKKADLTAWLGGKSAFAKTALSAQLAKVDTKALAWGAMSLSKPMDDKDMPVVAATAVVTSSKGSLSISARGTFANAAAAGKTLAEMNKDLKEGRDNKHTPPALKKLMTAIKLASAASDITLDATATEADLQAAITALVP